MAESPPLAEGAVLPDLTDGGDAIARLRARIERFGEGEQAAGDLRGIAERLLQAAGPLRTRLVGLPLPLPRERHQEARVLVDAELACASRCIDILGAMRSPFLHGFRGIEEVVETGLAMLADAFESCCMAGLAAPAGFWLSAHSLYLRAREEGFARAFPIYKRLLALSTVQPESFSSAELVDVFALARAFCDLGELVTGGSDPPGQGWFWVDFAQDVPPVAVVRREPPPVEDLGYFSAAALARSASERLTRPADTPGDPVEPVRSGDEALLRRLRERWAMPPRRVQPRRRSEYSVQVCAGLFAIWDRLVVGEKNSPTPMQWTVQNESPGGFAIMRVSGVAADLAAGMALALRRDEAASWAICVVRWIRSEQPEQIELGLQLVSQAAIPVRVAFRSGRSANGPVRALVLPPLAAVRRHQAVLAPAETYAARRFVLLHEGEHLYVAQGRLLSLDMQTQAIELFQFEVDPYPI